jgi:hypothetical protein
LYLGVRTAVPLAANGPLGLLLLLGMKAELQKSKTRLVMASDSLPKGVDNLTLVAYMVSSRNPANLLGGSEP